MNIKDSRYTKQKPFETEKKKEKKDVMYPLDDAYLIFNRRVGALSI
jgi:hypothetical protein